MPAPSNPGLAHRVLKRGEAQDLGVERKVRREAFGIAGDHAGPQRPVELYPERLALGPDHAAGPVVETGDGKQQLIAGVDRLARQQA